MKKTIMSAVLTLTAFTVVDRALGFVFKIYLSRELGAADLGVYQVALSFFFVLLTATTSGIPLIVSKLTAKYRAEGERRKERALTSAALLLGIGSAVAITAAALLLRGPVGRLFTDPRSSGVLLLLLPALLFSAVYSAFRGNLWGRQRYFMVSLVEILEQIARIAICIILFAAGFDRLSGTALSLSLGCLVSMAAVTALYFAARGRLASPKGQIVPLLRSSAPITVSRAASSLVSSVTAVVVPLLLMSSGFTRDQSMALYGSSVGMAMPLLYVPITVVGSLAFVMIPTVSTGIAGGDIRGVNAQIESAIGFSIAVAALFVPCFSALGEQIGRLVYADADSGRFLAAAAWLLVPLSVENITSSVMNSLGLEMRGFVNYLVGAALSLVMMLAFRRSFDITVMAAATGAGLTLSCILHVLAIRKKTGLRFTFMPRLVKSALLTFPAAFVTKCVYSLVCPGAGMWAAVIVGTLAGMAFFALSAWLLGLVDIDFFLTKVRTSGRRGKLRKRESGL